MTLLDADKDLILVWARSHPEIEAVWLFGSRARGDNRPESDIDLAVVTPTELHWIDNHRGYREELLVLSSKADLNWWQPELKDCPRLDKAIGADGVLLYQREGLGEKEIEIKAGGDIAAEKERVAQEPEPKRRRGKKR